MQLHPEQISPGENFDLFYFVRNHTDSTTYYVRAVIYDVRTGAVLSTNNLTQSPNNSRLFTATIQSPTDPQSLGRNIVSIASVYTDAAYTTKSTDYEEQEQYFLIRAEQMVFGGGGGIDYRTLREIVQEEIAKGIAGIEKPDPVSLPEFPDMPFDSVFGAIGALAREINRIPKEPAEIKPVLEQLRSLEAAIQALPEPNEPDLGPLMNAVQEMDNRFTTLPALLADQRTGLTTELKDIFTTTVAGMAVKVSQALTRTIQEQELTIPMRLSNPKPTSAPVDVSTLYER